ncbi:MAG: cysteine synthase A [Synergistetes bacterium]|nr:cysteine synthase A [Synergistota bacterium]MDW8192319.1 cysteine synthase A [Synergistota bacterium]
MKGVLDAIGNTPLVKLNYFSGRVNIYAKLEGNNPGGSVKDRPALFMFIDALKRKAINSERGIVEPTSGNTGIALSMLCAYYGVPCVLVMPESMSAERRALLSLYGAEIVLTPAGRGMKGAIEEAEKISLERNFFMPNQFSNPENVKAHLLTTGPEIISQMGYRDISAFVAGIGTGGTITGVGKVLKSFYPGIKIVGVEPSSSSVISGGNPGPHKIQGIGAGFIPSILDTALLDEVVRVDDEEAIEMAKLLPKKEGISAGISSGANLVGCLKVVDKLPPGSNVVTVFPDRADKYISVLL